MPQRKQKKQKNKYPRLVATVLLCPLIFAFSYAKINGRTFSLEEARTPTERAKGLMYRTIMKPDQGMIFIYNEETTISIWMKNTYIPLDIIWISKDHRIIDIQHGAPLSEDIHTPLSEAQFVIELNEGQIKNCKAKLGDLIILK